jgi:hypothetical protein
MLRRSKRSKNEVVATKEEEDELDKHIGMTNVERKYKCFPEFLHSEIQNCGQVTK